MSIRRGSDYGRRGPVPVGTPVASNDAALRSLVIELRRIDPSTPLIRLTGGDLHRTLGGPGPGDIAAGGGLLIVPIDLVEIATDEVETIFVSHLIAGPLFGRNFVAAMNAQWVGSLDLGPRSHPGDGLVDVTTGSMRFTERRAARRRAVTGTHVPHPALRVERVREWAVDLDRPTRIVVDGTDAGSTRRLSMRVVPDAFEIAI